MSCVVVVAAHPDDEVLGCGGTIAKHAASDDEVHVICLADGVGSRENNADALQVRRQAAENAAQILGVKSTTLLDFPDNRMDSLALVDIVKTLEERLDSLQPEIIYTHHGGDLNVDHRLTHQAVLTACRPQPGCSVKQIYAFEILSSTEWQSPGADTFIPNMFVDISLQLEKKKSALQEYAMEMRQPPHSRSIDNVIRLSEFRGNTVGCEHAEAFAVVRCIR